MQFVPDLRPTIETTAIMTNRFTQAYVEVLACHRRAPISSRTWPTVELSDWCGEWEEKDEQQE